MTEDDRLPADLTLTSRPSYDSSELFSDHVVPRSWTTRTEDPRIRNAEQYGATVTAHRHLRTAAIAMAGTDAATDQDRQQVWRVIHALATRIGWYQRENNLPPAEVTP